MICIFPCKLNFWQNCWCPSEGGGRPIKILNTDKHNFSICHQYQYSISIFAEFHAKFDRTAGVYLKAGDLARPIKILFASPASAITRVKRHPMCYKPLYGHGCGTQMSDLTDLLSLTFLFWRGITWDWHSAFAAYPRRPTWPLCWGRRRRRRAGLSPWSWLVRRQHRLQRPRWTTCQCPPWTPCRGCHTWRSCR